jgi:TatA/E family protein of Tat protein translocase
MLGPQDLWIALALGVFFFGAKKLPELSRSLGQAMSEFKKGVTGTADEQPPAPPAAPVKPEGATAKPEGATAKSEGATKEESTG